MLNNAKKLNGYKLHCLDGEIGSVNQFYFDDHYWTVRYLVADTGNWLTGRQVLISPYALISMDKENQSISINLTKQQIKDSPSLNTDKPVSQQFEDVYYGYYGWTAYYNGPYMWGPDSEIVVDHKRLGGDNQNGKKWNPHLRSTQEVTGYHIQATDGEIGHVDDFIIDDKTWAIRYLIVDTQNWWPGKKVLVSPKWIKQISWKDSKIFINLSCQTIKLSPEYTEEFLLNRDYEIGLHQHYKHKGYWVDEAHEKKQSR